MSTLHTSRTTLAIAALAVLAACGGSEAPPSPTQAFADALASTPTPARSDRLRALAAGVGGGATSAAAGPITNDQLFLGAQAIFPELFPATPAPSTINNLAFQGKVFTVKAYANGNFLAISNDGMVWGLGPYTGGAPVQFGAVQSYADLVCSRISCGSTGGGTGGGGTLNECAGPDPSTLASGFKTRSVFIYTGPISGEQTVETEKKGTTTFEGQSVTETLATTKGSNSVEGLPGVSLATTTTSKVYTQTGSNGLTKSIGALIDVVTAGLSFGGVTLPDTTVSSKVVYNPAVENTEFTLAVGQSLTKTSNTRTTILSSSAGIPAPGTVTDLTDTTTWTFEAKESISVPAGTFNTCRYSTTSSGSTGKSWLIIGKGMLAKSEATISGSGTQKVELKSGTYGGAPL